MLVRETKEELPIEFEEKLQRLKNTVEAYKKELQGLAEWKIQAKLYQDFSQLLVSVNSCEELYVQLLEIVFHAIKARFYGIFTLNSHQDTFEFCCGKGYAPGFMSAIPRSGSLMGECLLKRDCLWIPQLRLREGSYIPLNQEPHEYNVIIIPIITENSEIGVIRIGNVDTEAIDLTLRLLRSVSQLLGQGIIRILQFKQNTHTLQGVEASFTIARLLENTLSEGDILKKVCAQVPKLFPCAVSCITLKIDDAMKTIYSLPPDFYFGGNSSSHTIYLRNLLEAFPSGNACIADIHKDRRWSWPIKTVKSLCIASLHVRGIMKGLIIAIGPVSETYDSSHANLLGLVATQTSITLERASYFRRQEELASRDGLTNLLNHRMFQETIRAEIERARRYNRPLSLVMFDIDHFKKFNDTYGHPVGDEILKMVALTTKSTLRTTDYIFRYGGEEFCVLLPETTTENAFIFAERLRTKIEQNRAVRRLSVTISLGIAQYRMHELAQHLIKKADQALYKSKQGGRNRTTIDQ
ncbi:MAG: diguanylate cyclase [Chitinivibrionales bacterium]|nr:diguanylate cyclase [Chitinivibrionales bacterium]